MNNNLGFFLTIFIFVALSNSTKLGINHWGGFYQINSDRDQLIDGAEFLKLISPPIKINLGPNDAYLGMDKPLVTYENGKIDIHESALFVLDNFDPVTLIAFNPNKTKWKDGFDDDERNREIEFFSALTDFLYENYGDKERTIFIQNWESDNAIGDLTDFKIENMKEWMRARWTGVNDARRPDSKMKVLCGMEFNHVLGYKTGEAGMIDHVEDLEIDFGSYSFYEWNKKNGNITEGVENMRKGIEKIQNNLKQITPIGLEVLGDRKCYVGEFGAGFLDVDIRFVPAVKEMLSDIGVKYGFFWNLFNNEEGREFFIVSPPPDLSLSPVIQSFF